MVPLEDVFYFWLLSSLAFLCRKVFYQIIQVSLESPRGTVVEESVPARHSCRFPFCTSLLVSAHVSR